MLSEWCLEPREWCIQWEKMSNNADKNSLLSNKLGYSTTLEIPKKFKQQIYVSIIEQITTVIQNILLSYLWKSQVADVNLFLTKNVAIASATYVKSGYCNRIFVTQIKKYQTTISQMYL